MPLTDLPLGSQAQPRPIPELGRPKCSVNGKVVLSILVLFWTGSGLCVAQALYSTEREFGPMRFSHEELLELVSRLQGFSERQGSTAEGVNDARQTSL